MYPKLLDPTILTMTETTRLCNALNVIQVNSLFSVSDDFHIVSASLMILIFYECCSVWLHIQMQESASSEVATDCFV